MILTSDKKINKPIKTNGPTSHPAFTLIIVLIFLCVGFVNIFNHEMWLDELQAWSISKDSTSIENLFHNYKDNGHPMLWYLCLYLLSRFSDNPIAMQYLHLVIAVLVITVFVKYSPFSKLQKTLFVFGYFPLYEYCTISRNYALGILFIFVFCAVFKNRLKSLLLPVCMLFLLAQISVYGTIISVCLGGMLLFEFTFDDNSRKSLADKKKSTAIFILIFIVGIAISVLQLIPGPDSGITTEWYFQFIPPRLLQTLTAIWTGYFPTIKLDYAFWDIHTPGRNTFISIILEAAVSLLILFFVSMSFIRKPKVLLLFITGNAGLLLFAYIKHSGFTRHHGHLFILFIMSLWISHYYPYTDSRSFKRLADFSRRHKNKFIISIFSIHLVAGILACSLDWLYPFSASKEVAQFIKDNKMDDMVIVAQPDFVASPVAGYLNRKIYYVAGERFGTYIIWDKKRLNVDPKRTNVKIRQFLSEHKEGILFLSNQTANLPGLSIVKIKEFDRSILPQEKYHLYLIKSR